MSDNDGGMDGLAMIGAIVVSLAVVWAMSFILKAIRFSFWDFSN